MYDRVLPSRSVPTLIGLIMIAAILYACHGLLDLIRGRILVRIGGVIDDALSGRVYDLVRVCRSGAAIRAGGCSRSRI